ncbi:MAG: NERD domain-containing protein [Porticoccaceae bacterium]|nr:NERD domain-containing protein [Porticoccaceae bacterium]
MDFTPIIQQVYGVLWWLIPLAMITAVVKSPWFKGVVGETLVKFTAKVRLPSDVYHPVHNVTLPTLDGTTQIDHIFVSVYGIFVVETKNMKGWIFGTEKQAQWTQKIFKKSYCFQNPLRQNYKHIKTLSSALNLEEEHIHSVIVFAGESTFKTKMPPNVTRGGGFVTYIKSFEEKVLSDSQVYEAVDKIESGRLTPSRAINRQHVANLKSRSDATSEQKCPKCGSAMLLRTAKRGSNTGNQFWGCSEYPACKTIRNLN